MGNNIFKGFVHGDWGRFYVIAVDVVVGMGVVAVLEYCDVINVVVVAMVVVRVAILLL